MTQVLVATWQIDTADAQFQARSLHDRLLAFDRALNLVKTELQNEQAGGNHTNHAIQAVFAAPEYYFAAQNAGQEFRGLTRIRHGRFGRRDLTETQKETVLGSIRAASHNANGILIVPGTVAWSKPFDREKGILRHRNKVGARPRRQKAQEHMTAANAALAGHRAATYRGQTVPTVTKKDRMIGSRLPHRRRSRILRNSMYCYFNGVQEHKYNKMKDFHEGIGARDTVFVTGDIDRKETDIQGKHCVFEVCFDHACGTLEQLNAGAADYHVIVSACVRADHSSLLPGGACIHASSEPSLSVVYQKDAGGGNPTRVNPYNAPGIAVPGGGFGRVLFHRIDG